jgi:hypothetical protein
MDWFLPVLILSILLFAFLWWHEFHAMGGREIALYLETVFGVRIEYLRRQQRKLAAINSETTEWTNKEVDRVYGGNTDPSGKIFMEYSNLFTNLAVLDATKLDQLRGRQKSLQHNRSFRVAAIQEILKDLGKDMTFNTNAIEGNPLTAHETSIILSGFSVGRGRKLRDVFDIIGHQKAFEEMLHLVRNESDLTMEHLKQLHKLVLFDSGDGGILRSGHEIAMISGVKNLFAPPGGRKPREGISSMVISKHDREYSPIPSCCVMSQCVCSHSPLSRREWADGTPANELCSY